MKIKQSELRDIIRKEIASKRSNISEIFDPSVDSNVARSLPQDYLPGGYVSHKDKADATAERLKVIGEFSEENSDILRNKNTLKPGAKGPRVSSLQKLIGMRMKQNNIPEPTRFKKYGADGDFGSGTEEAVVVMQKHYGVQMDGEVGQQTALSLIQNRKATDIRYSDSVDIDPAHVPSKKPDKDELGKIPGGIAKPVEDEQKTNEKSVTLGDHTWVWNPTRSGWENKTIETFWKHTGQEEESSKDLVIVRRDRTTRIAPYDDEDEKETGLEIESIPTFDDIQSAFEIKSKRDPFEEMRESRRWARLAGILTD